MLTGFVLCYIVVTVFVAYHAYMMEPDSEKETRTKSILLLLFRAASWPYIVTKILANKGRNGSND